MRRDDDWALAFGYTLGSALIPSVVVLVYYRWKNRNASAARKIAALATWVLIANLFNVSHAKPKLTKADMPLILKEAAGLAPVKDPNDAARTALREYFQDIISQNKIYTAEVDKLNIPNLYTPQSYLDEEEARQIIVQLEGILSTEEKQEAALKDIRGRLVSRINALDWQNSEKKEFLKGFDEKFDEVESNRQKLLETETVWVNSVIDLYNFAIQDHRFFHLNEGHIIITNPEILDQFNKRIDRSNELGKQYKTALQSFKKNQESWLSDFGASSRDFGATP
jgi:hypothetical protein